LLLSVTDELSETDELSVCDELSAFEESAFDELLAQDAIDMIIAAHTARISFLFFIIVLLFLWVLFPTESIP
jgi:hypothetical protein